MPPLQLFDFYPQIIVSLYLVIDLFFVALPQFINFLIIFFLLVLKLLIQVIVLFGGILNVGLLDLFIGFKCNFILLLKVVHLLPVNYF